MKKISIIIAILIVGMAITSCGAVKESDPTIVPVIAPRYFIIEGHVVPKSNLTLTFTIRAKVAEILVANGEKVTAGQVLIRLGDQDQARAALAGAKLEQIIANQAYDEFLRTSDLSHAQAWQNYINAQQVRAAAERAWESLNLSTIDENISNAQVDVNTAKVDLAEAQKEFDKYKNLDEDDETRKIAEDDLKTAQNVYNETLRKLEEAINRRDLPRAALDTALAVEAEARRNFENTQSEADSDMKTLLQERLQTADAQVSAAQSLLDSYELKAPVDGMIADINLVVGQLAGPETWAIILADMNEWYVETSDLSELDVVKVEVGQEVELIADALPEQVIYGMVEEISNVPGFQGGDVLYTVRIHLKETDADLRWGMTVEIKFPENELE